MRDEMNVCSYIYVTVTYAYSSHILFKNFVDGKWNEWIFVYLYEKSFLIWYNNSYVKIWFEMLYILE